METAVAPLSYQLNIVVRDLGAGDTIFVIIPDDGGKGLFVHITAVQQAGYTSLVPGTRLSYDIGPDREGNPTAESLKIGYRRE